MVKSHLFQKRVSVPYAAEVLSKCFCAKTEDSLTLDLSHPMIQLDPSAEKDSHPDRQFFCESVMIAQNGTLPSLASPSSLILPHKQQQH